VSPLDADHRRLGARMVDFGGWEMPVSYLDGTLVEHRACREAAVAFDVSHLGTVVVNGEEAFDRLQGALTNDLNRIGPGRAQYTHLLDPDDASVVDDIIVWWLDGVADPGNPESRPSEFHVMPNASNTAEVVGAIGGDDVTDGRAVIAVQGPLARQRLAEVAPEAADVARFAVRRVEWRGAPCVAAGTGYTGEDGVEISVPANLAPSFWQAVLGSGVVPAGLGARDTLRLEAGLPLHGHELGPGITPLQAGLGWVVAWDKGPFRGRDALEAERATGVTRALRGLATEGRQPPRQGCPVLVDGSVVGEVTSGNFSPTLGHGIGLALLDPTVEAGAEVMVEVRGRALAARVVPTPFVGKRRT